MKYSKYFQFVLGLNSFVSGGIFIYLKNNTLLQADYSCKGFIENANLVEGSSFRISYSPFSLAIATSLTICFGIFLL